MNRPPYYDDGDVTLHHGHALDIAKTLPTGSVRTIVTSPPYFGLRDYGHDDQLGAEPTVDEYVGNLVTLFRELRRVLADDGTLWLNLGDSYARSGDPHNDNQINEWKGRPETSEASTRTIGTALKAAARRQDSGLPSKNLLGVPWRVAFALQADGWILRSDIIWAKPNPMPESVTDRPTKAHEYLFLLAKQARYYYDADAMREDSAPSSVARRGLVKAPTQKHHEQVALGRQAGRHSPPGESEYGTGRNRRSVWEIPTAPFPGAHFAVYPPELIRPCILAGSAPGDTVLDPFSGSGTTGMVAGFEGRKYVGIDINADYLDLSIRSRFAQPTLGIETVA